MQKAVFLDRDGVIIEDTGYPDDCHKLKFLPKVSEAIKLLNDNGFKVIVATNQSGVARGYFTEKELKKINRFIQDTLAEQGAVIDKFYYCPHHIEGTVEEYRKECYYRKPSPGMLEKAADEYDIDLKKSFLIGDTLSDIETGHRVGSCTILIVGEPPPENEKETQAIPDHTATDLYEAVTWLLEFNPQESRRS